MRWNQVRLLGGHVTPISCGGRQSPPPPRGSLEGWALATPGTQHWIPSDSHGIAQTAGPHVALRLALRVFPQKETQARLPSPVQRERRKPSPIRYPVGLTFAVFSNIRLPLSDSWMPLSPTPTPVGPRDHLPPMGCEKPRWVSRRWAQARGRGPSPARAFFQAANEGTRASSVDTGGAASMTESHTGPLPGTVL